MLTALLVLMVVLSNAAGDVLLTRGMKQVGDVSVLSAVQLLQAIKRIGGNLYFISGVICLAVSFFSFLTVLSWADLSFVVPATAIVYVITVLGAKFFLGEEIDRMRWAGTLLVCVGVAFICLPENHTLSISLPVAPVRVFFGILTTASICYYLAAMIAAEIFFRRRDAKTVIAGDVERVQHNKAAESRYRRNIAHSRPCNIVSESAVRSVNSSRLPPFSILVPLCGADFRAYENYASLCRQDYPKFEIIFGVADSTDSSLPVIAELQKNFPGIPIQLVISSKEIGPNPKVNNLNNMLSAAKHETLLMLDSDIKVGPDFLKTISEELPPNAEGLLTCLYRAGQAPGIPSKLEAIGITAEFAPGVLVAHMAGGISFAFGAAIAVSRRTLDAIGGFHKIAPYLADDYMMGNLARKAGLPVILSEYVVETVLSKLTLSGFLRHQLRWARGIRACAPLGHTGSVLTNGTVLSFLYFAFSGFSLFGFLVLASVAGLRILMAWRVGVRHLEDDILKKSLPLVPVRDFFSFFIWAGALFGTRVDWRNRVFRLEKDGRMRPEFDVKPNAPARDPRAAGQAG